MKRPSRLGRGTWATMGAVAVALAVLWLLFWGVIAIAVGSWGTDAHGAVLVGTATVAGVGLLLLGLTLVRGRPGWWGWLPSAVILLAVGAILGGAWRDAVRAGPINRAVEQALARGDRYQSVDADCDKFDDRANGSEAWICDVSLDFDSRTCFAYVRREPRLSVRLDCDGGMFNP